MDAAEQRAMYRAVCQHAVIVRRYSGTDAARSATNYAAMGNARLYSAKELIGAITQGDQAVIVLAEDLETAGFTFPLKTSDKVVVSSFERAIVAFGERRALDGTLVAYEITARG